MSWCGTVLVSSLVASASLTVLARSPLIPSIDGDTLGVEQLLRLTVMTASNKPVSIMLIATIRPATAAQVDGEAQRAPDVAVKAAFLFNFTKFTVWPTLPLGVPIVACIVGDDGIAAALVEIVRGHTVDDRRLVVGRSQESAKWRECHLLFIADAQIQRSAEGLAGIAMLPVLTVSDNKGFAQSGGIIELYANAGQLQFVINMEAADRSGLRLSSRLLSLAKVIRKTRSGW